MTLAHEAQGDIGPSEDEKALRRRAEPTLGRGVWMGCDRAEHPAASCGEITSTWAEACADFTKVGLAALTTLEKAGMQKVVATWTGD